jgi:hypothetical protein
MLSMAFRSWRVMALRVGVARQAKAASASCFSQSANNNVQYAIFTTDYSVLVTTVYFG